MINPILFLYLITCVISFLEFFKAFKECIDIFEEKKYELDEKKIIKEEETTTNLPWWLGIIGFSSMPIFNIILASVLAMSHDEIINMVINAMDQYKK